MSPLVELSTSRLATFVSIASATPIPVTALMTARPAAASILSTSALPASMTAPVAVSMVTAVLEVSVVCSRPIVMSPSASISIMPLPARMLEPSAISSCPAAPATVVSVVTVTLPEVDTTVPKSSNSMESSTLCSVTVPEFEVIDESSSMPLVIPLPTSRIVPVPVASIVPLSRSMPSSPSALDDTPVS